MEGIGLRQGTGSVSLNYSRHHTEGGKIVNKLGLMLRGLLLFFIFHVPGGQQVCAQSNILNSPSTDVVNRGSIYAEFDLISHLESHQDGGFQSYVTRMIFGLGRGTEAGINLAITDPGGPDTPIEIQPNAKWQFFNNERRGVAVVIGGILYLPVNHHAGHAGADSFAMTYTTCSKKFKAAYGPRFTGGAYRLIGRDGAGAHHGVMIGYEQPLHSKVSLVADWFSGHNRFGYVGGGLIVSLPKNNVLQIGYSIGNQGRKNNALTVFYGITF